LTVAAFFRCHDVDLPAGQLRCQTHVLTTRTNRLGQVFFVYHHVHGVLVFVHQNGFDVCRRQSTDHKFGRIIRPQHDIDLLTAQLVAHRSHARTTHAHASTDRIDALVISNNGDLGAHTRITG